MRIRVKGLLLCPSHFLVCRTSTVSVANFGPYIPTENPRVSRNIDVQYHGPCRVLQLFTTYLPSFPPVPQPYFQLKWKGLRNTNKGRHIASVYQRATNTGKEPRATRRVYERVSMRNTGASSVGPRPRWGIATMFDRHYTRRKPRHTTWVQESLSRTTSTIPPVALRHEPPGKTSLYLKTQENHI